ncbi:hypothetical protein E4U59_007040 [Claviceps monticola]|nr:hypothetical protein E4U59_007040 [Claviceps monticola]
MIDGAECGIDSAAGGQAFATSKGIGLNDAGQKRRFFSLISVVQAEELSDFLFGQLPELSLDVILHRSCGMASNNNKRLLNEKFGALWNTNTGYQTSSLAGQFFNVM